MGIVLSGLTYGELRVQGKVTTHLISGHSESYFGVGRPCPRCKRCWFVSSFDLNEHLRVCTVWRKSRFQENEEWCFSSEDLEITSTVRLLRGKLRIGNWEYRLSPDGKYLKRRIVAG